MAKEQYDGPTKKDQDQAARFVETEMNKYMRFVDPETDSKKSTGQSRDKTSDGKSRSARLRMP